MPREKYSYYQTYLHTDQDTSKEYEANLRRFLVKDIKWSSAYPGNVRRKKRSALPRALLDVNKTPLYAYESLTD